MQRRVEVVEEDRGGIVSDKDCRSRQLRRRLDEADDANKDEYRRAMR